MKEALSAGDPLTDLPLALQVDYFRVSPTAYFVPVSVKIPGSVVALAAKGGASVTQFDFVGQIQDEQHAVVGNVRDYIKIKLDQDAAAKAGRKSFQYDAGFTLEPGKYHMKFLVRENVTGKMGTFETRFTIPDLSADTSGLKLSTVIWSSQREPLKAAVGAAEKVSKKEAERQPADRRAMRRSSPTSRSVFRRNQNLYVNFDVYDARPDPANSKCAPRQSQHEPVQPEGRKGFRGRPARCNTARAYAAGSRARAVPGAAERSGARPVHLPDQCGGRGRAKVCFSALSLGGPVTPAIFVAGLSCFRQAIFSIPQVFFQTIPIVMFSRSSHAFKRPVNHCYNWIYNLVCIPCNCVILPLLFAANGRAE